MEVGQQGLHVPLLNKQTRERSDQALPPAPSISSTAQTTLVTIFAESSSHMGIFRTGIWYDQPYTGPLSVSVAVSFTTGPMFPPPSSTSISLRKPTSRLPSMNGERPPGWIVPPASSDARATICTSSSIRQRQSRRLPGRRSTRTKPALAVSTIYPHSVQYDKWLPRRSPLRATACETTGRPSAHSAQPDPAHHGTDARRRTVKRRRRIRLWRRRTRSDPY